MMAAATKVTFFDMRKKMLRRGSAKILYPQNAQKSVANAPKLTLDELLLLAMTKPGVQWM